MLRWQQRRPAARPAEPSQDSHASSVSSRTGSRGARPTPDSPRCPSFNRSVILQPDKSVTGGMKVVRQAQESEVAKGYTPSVA